MANICGTEYTFYSKNKSELKRFHDYFEYLLNEADKGILIKRKGNKNFSKTYTVNYYLMQAYLNIPVDNMDQEAQGTLTGISDIFMYSNLYCFRLYMDDIRCVYFDAFERIIDWRFADIYFAYIAENHETGMFTIYDPIGIYPYKYIVTGCVDSCFDKIRACGEKDIAAFETEARFSDQKTCRDFLYRLIQKVAEYNDIETFGIISKESTVDELTDFANEHFADSDYLNVYTYNVFTDWS